MVVAHAAHDVLVAGPVAFGLLVVAVLTWRSARQARSRGAAPMRR